MAAYRKITDFRVKDSLRTGTVEKAIRGVDLDNEFLAVAAALNSMISGAYSKTTNFRVKDYLTSGNADKLVDGAELDVEFSAISAGCAACGGSYTPITDFSAISAGTDILGDLIQDEFDAINTAIQAVWVAGGGASWGGLDYGTSWTYPISGTEAITLELVTYDAVAETADFSWTADSGATSYRLYGVDSQTFAGGAYFDPGNLPTYGEMLLLTTTGGGVTTASDVPTDGIGLEKAWAFYVQASPSGNYSNIIFEGQPS